MTFVLLAVLVTVTMAMVDFAAARYTIAMADVRLGRGVTRPWWRTAKHRASAWSVVQWAAAAVGFVVAVRVSMWLLPFEGLGLYIGTLLGSGTQQPGRGVDPT